MVLKSLAIVALGLVVSCSRSRSNSRTSNSTETQQQSSPTPQATASTETAVQPQTSSTLGSATNDAVMPPVQYYTALAQQLQNYIRGVGTDISSQAQERATQLVWVNFDGARVKKGYGSGESFIVCSDEAVIQASSVSSAKQAEILEAAQQYYSTVYADAEFTLTQPTGLYTTLHVMDGNYDMLGCEEDDRILGIAPLDLSNPKPDDVAFIFLGSVPQDRFTYVAGVTIAHEAAHSFGLSHVDSTADVMAAVLPDAVEGFSSARRTSFPWGTQNAPELLRRNLGTTADYTGPAPQASTNLIERSCESLSILGAFMRERFPNFFNDDKRIFNIPGNCLN